MDYKKYIELKNNDGIVLEKTKEGKDDNSVIECSFQELVETTDRVTIKGLNRIREGLIKQITELQENLNGLDEMISDIELLSSKQPIS